MRLILLKIWGLLLLETILCITVSANSNNFNKLSIYRPAPKETIKVSIIARNRDFIFNGKKVRFRIHLQSTYSTKQEGTVVYEVRTDKNKKVLGTKFENIVIPPNGNINLRTKFTLAEPGFYACITTINLSDYDDTIRRVFGYKPDLINTPVYKPDDFDEFWTKTKKELASIDPKYEITLDKTRTTDTHYCYNVKMHSYNDIVTRAWLVIPKLGGKYPVVLTWPGYNGEPVPIYYPADQAVMGLTVRKVADLNDRGMNPSNEKDLCMVNIADKDNFLYRGLFMDCLRAVDFIFANNSIGLDTSRIIVCGGSQGASMAIVAAALDQRINVCVADLPIFCDMRNFYEISNNTNPDKFPISYFNRFVKASRYGKRDFFKTFDYYDIQNFVPKLKCPCIFLYATLDVIAPPACVYAAYNKLTGKAKRKSEIHVLVNKAHEVDAKFMYIQSLWIQENSIQRTN